ncbi:hypothetical protein SAMN04489761_2587 [Tenacibaculum sp. MAR_2009_124]|uniref:hypothetical protein n=1 Tax=Tenacibaculum sp. MAR_2009_124 TaxID=1250059 RepID=UPI0008966EA4|nr:hypothetical protein [Tenacibaculum sp. MAR_2009_124]SEC28920.1 hypothetical protein SAMN04489761_2587 [Tenacibaculum sp. MAR_2009_124]
MTDFYEKLKQYKKEKSLTYNDLGELISVSGDTFRMAMNKKTFSKLRQEKLLSIINSQQTSAHLSESNIFYEKEGVKFSIDEIISFLTVNIKLINNSGKLENLINAINTVKNIDQYNTLSEEIEKIKSLLERNKDVLK